MTHTTRGRAHIFASLHIVINAQPAAPQDPPLQCEPAVRLTFKLPLSLSESAAAGDSDRPLAAGWDSPTTTESRGVCAAAGGEEVRAALERIAMALERLEKPPTAAGPAVKPSGALATAASGRPARANPAPDSRR